MLVEKGTSEMMTQREHSRLALVVPSMGSDTLRVEAPGMPPLEIPIVYEGQRHVVMMWKRDECHLVDQGAAIAEWFSQFLGHPCHLTRMAQDWVRPVSPNFARRERDRVSLADGYPYLIISEESLADLNSRLDEPLPMNRFRPNIVIAGSGIPYGEDRLDRIRLGEVELDIVKPCARCAITTTDQQTTLRGKEPLKTLATYRRDETTGSVMFGQNVLPATTGLLRVGDRLEVLELKQPK